MGWGALSPWVQEGVLDSSASGLPDTRAPSSWGSQVCFPHGNCPSGSSQLCHCPPAPPALPFRAAYGSPQSSSFVELPVGEVPPPFSSLALTSKQCSQSPGRACVWITEDEPSRKQKENEQPVNLDFITFTQKMLWSFDLNLRQDPCPF